MISVRFSIIVLVCASFAPVFPWIPTQESASGSAARPLDLALKLLKECRNEDSSYRHKGGRVTWKGDGGLDTCECHTDCSGFITALLSRAYGYSHATLEHWLGSSHPGPVAYHDAIIAGRGFKRISVVKDIEAGDIVAIRYPSGLPNTGHMLLVSGKPARRTASKPLTPDTDQWEMSVIDVSESGHGKADTRHNEDGTFRQGLGQGSFRVYSSGDGTLRGYSWSAQAASEYFDGTQRSLVVGRLDPSFKP